MMRPIAVSVFILALSGCGVSPEPDYYMLAAVDGAVAPDIGVNFQVERPIIPDYLDRPQIVYQDSPHQISFDEMQRWGAPIDTMIEDILTEDLRQRMPNGVIVKEEDDLSTRPPVRVEVEIETFNATPDGAVLKAHILVDTHHQCGTENPLPIAFTAASPDHGIVTAQSQLIAAMADRITLIARDNKGVFCSNDLTAHKASASSHP